MIYRRRDLIENKKILPSGYKRVRTFDKNQSIYYYKNGKPTNVDDLFIDLEIKDLASF